MTSRPLWLLCLGVVLVASACLPGHSVSKGGELVQITGRLGGELLNDGSPGGDPCVWLVEPDGKRTYLFLLDDAMVQFQPLRLLDATGSVLAHEGDTVTVNGPSGGVGFTSCSPGVDPFLVGKISGPGGVRTFNIEGNG
jgi:hypothetical protein